jgi:4-amino-4-deoxy-L-arabinose transferase-like glycosyltransferase
MDRHMGDQSIQTSPTDIIDEAQVDANPSRARIAGLLLKLLAGFCLILPIAYVLNDRWVKEPFLKDTLADVWHRMEFFSSSRWPDYFLIIIPCSLVFLGLFLWKANRHNPFFGCEVFPQVPQPIEMEVSPTQQKIARYLLRVAAGIVLVSVFFVLINQRVPNLEILAAVGLVWMAQAFRTNRWEEMRHPSGSAVRRALLLGLGQVALIFFLHALEVDHTEIPMAATLLLGTWILVMRLAHPGPIYWIVAGAMSLMTLGVDSWRFSFIGDEYAFYYTALNFFTPDGIRQLYTNFFNGTAVYHSHPLFSSTLQAASMALFGKDSFGWRSSSTYLAAVSLFFFYGFFKNFFDRRIALWAAIFLGASHYLMNFSKVGYNNTQTLFAFGLVLWASARAASRRTPLAYTGLGAAIGLCFYLFPGSLYVVPLPFLFLLLYDSPKDRAARSRWLDMLCMLSILIVPLLFQPDYWSGKIPGTFLYSTQTTGSSATPSKIIYNTLYSTYSYLYTVSESHYVVASYIDPISAIFLPIGFAWSLSQVRRNRFAVFSILSYLAFILLVGASHNYDAPPATRMFMLLPWFALFSALGLQWLDSEYNSYHLPIRFKTAQHLYLGAMEITVKFAPPNGRQRHSRSYVLAGVVLAAMLATNIYMANGLEMQRTAGMHELDALYIRMFQRNRDMGENSTLTYLFVTDQNWNIYEVLYYPGLYNVPASVSQLQRVQVDRADLPEEYVNLAKKPDTVVIVQPSLDSQIQAGLTNLLQGIGKNACPMREVPEWDARFTMFLSPERMNLCPQDGHWN